VGLEGDFLMVFGLLGFRDLGGRFFFEPLMLPNAFQEHFFLLGNPLFAMVRGVGVVRKFVGHGGGGEFRFSHGFPVGRRREGAADALRLSAWFSQRPDAAVSMRHGAVAWGRKP
jgi:hypothetical protein